MLQVNKLLVNSGGKWLDMPSSILSQSDDADFGDVKNIMWWLYQILYVIIIIFYLLLSYFLTFKNEIFSSLLELSMKLISRLTLNYLIHKAWMETYHIIKQVLSLYLLIFLDFRIQGD